MLIFPVHAPAVLALGMIVSAFGASAASAENKPTDGRSEVRNVAAAWPAERARCRPVPLRSVEVGGFLGRRIDQNLRSLLTGLESPIPRGFEARAAGRDLPPEAQRLAADSDLYKWLEGACYVLARTGDVRVGRAIDRISSLILDCQHEDGYINTQVPPGKRFDPRVNHDLYIAGHFFEAAVAHFRATGRRELLEAACRWADYLIREYERGNPYYKTVGQREHPEYELGLVRLGRAAEQPKYAEFAIRLAKTSTVGPKVAEIHAGAGKLHAVRTGYLLAGMADLYLETGRRDLYEHLPGLWEELVETRMYVTGAVGSHGERIDTSPFVLPNARADHDHRHLGETCACVAMIMFTWRLHAVTGRSECFDVIERALYNHYLGALSLDNLGNFYYNPLHVVGDVSGKTDHGHSPMTARCRLPKIHSTACCMPNAWRFLGALPEYLFSYGDDGLFVNLYTSSRVRHRFADGRHVDLKLETDYPWDGSVKFTFLGDRPTTFALRLRVPGWCPRAAWKVEGEPAERTPGGKYWTIRRTWRNGDTGTLEIEMPVRMIVPDPRIRSNAGRVAFARGPIVYCLEKEDIDFPVEAAHVALKPEEVAKRVRVQWREELLGGVNVLRVPASPPVPEARPAELTLVPFYARANRSDDSRWVVFLPNDGESNNSQREASP